MMNTGVIATATRRDNGDHRRAKLSAQTTSSTISENRISLKAAFLALPECFMQPKGKV